MISREEDEDDEGWLFLRFAVEGCCSSSWVVIGADVAGSWWWWYRDVAVESELLEDADDELSCCGVVGVVAL